MNENDKPEKDLKQVRSEAKAEARVQREIQRWSTDYDMTLVAKCVFAALFFFIGLLVVLEVFSRSVWDDTEPMYFTPEIGHAIFGFVAGCGSTIVSFLYGKKMAESRTAKAEQEKGGGD